MSGCLRMMESALPTSADDLMSRLGGGEPEDESEADRFVRGLPRLPFAVVRGAILLAD